jgi:hypothetical protein
MPVHAENVACGLERFVQLLQLSVKITVTGDRGQQFPHRHTAVLRKNLADLIKVFADKGETAERGIF